MEISEKDKEYMRLALEEAALAAAEDEVPIGAVVVWQPIDKATRKPTSKAQIIARAHNQREQLQDPAAHAEHIAIQQASKHLNAWRLTDCTVYVTLEPCIMCAGLMHQARIERCIYGAPDTKAGALKSLYSINTDKRLNHRFEAVGGVLQEECIEVLREFFAKRR